MTFRLKDYSSGCEKAFTSAINYGSVMDTRKWNSAAGCLLVTLHTILCNYVFLEMFDEILELLK